MNPVPDRDIIKKFLGVEELNNDLASTKLVDGATEPYKEKRFASVDEVETLKEHNGSGASSTKTSMQHRPESLKIMAMREQGGGSTSDISRKESNKTKGSESAKTLDTRPPVIALHPPAGIRRSKRRPHSQKHQSSVRKNQKTNKPTKRGADFTRLTCSYCGARLESFDEETLSLCCVALCTFLQRVPSLAAPLLQRTLLCTARFIDIPQFPWHESNIFVPGNAKSAAKQLIRIILHQLSGSGIALQLFNLHIQADELYSFWSKIALSLVDFTELNPVAFLQNLLEVKFCGEQFFIYGGN
ncbi:unnamed protein product [Meloidogyne enterolobii]|uniref:Uncharacterized protein n=1 Tax=Meloidogyne enterolobii TaxID=390850 RepID=A0ACB1A588_MELEN